MILYRLKINFSYAMSNIIMERNICIEPQYLNNNIHQNLLVKLREVTANECTKKYGYILEILRIYSVLDNQISFANSDIVFTVKFEAKILKPEIGSIFEGEVCMIIKDCLFVDIKKKLKVLVQLGETGYKLDTNDNCMVKGDMKIYQGDLLKVCITGVKYCKQRFNCFGNLVNE